MDSADAKVGGTTSQAAASQDVAKSKIRLRGRSFLLTYNWDFFGKATKDGTAPAVGPPELWSAWLVWKKAKKKELGVSRSTSTMEESLNSGLAYRVHFHWKIDLKEAIDHSTKDAFLLWGIPPDVRSPWAQSEGAHNARGANYAEVNNRAHFYCFAPKFGTLYTGSNYKPFVDYRVQGRWLEDLWGDNKISDEDYMKLSVKVKN